MPSSSALEVGQATGAARRWFPERWGPLLWWSTLVAFVLLSIAVLADLTSSWDTAATSAAVAHRTSSLTHVAVALGWVGLPGIVAAWAGLGAFALDRIYRTSWRCLVRVLAVLLLDVIVVYAVKHVVDRSRPPSELWLVSASTPSFPSGHATATTAGVSMLLLCLAALRAPARARAWATAIGILLVIAVGWSRVYLGVHHLSDVLAGASLGLWLSLSTAWAFDVGARRRERATGRS